METTLIKKQDITLQFALASKNKDIELLMALLSEDGSFHIQNSSRETIEVRKEEFLRWYKEKLEATTIESIEYDQCLFCLLGSPVVLFNNGKFPRLVKDCGERTKTGLALNIKDNKIAELGFCYSLLKTENKPIFEATFKKIAKYIEAGVPKKEAIAKGRTEESKEFNLVQGKTRIR